MWPLWKAISLFEENDTSIISIYPIWQQIISYWNDLSDYFKKKFEKGIITENEYSGWTESISFLNNQLEFRSFHTYDWPMITLSFCFSPSGRMMYQKQLKETGITVLYDECLEDKSPCKFDYVLFKENDFENDPLEKILQTFSR